MNEFTRDELRRAALAMRVIVEAGAREELREQVAYAWQAERERKLSRTIGDGMPAAIELAKLLRIDHRSANEAIEATATRSYERVKFDELIFLGRELWNSRRSANGRRA